MIEIGFNTTFNKVEIQFSGSEFHDILTFCKEEHLEYMPETKSWLCIPKRFLDKDILKGFEEIDSVYMNQKVNIDIQNAINKTEIKRQRIRYNPNIVNFEPLKGIPPNEAYQLNDIKRFLAVNRGGVFWEQRLGKAVWLAVHLSHLFHNNKVDKSIILTPSSGVYNLRKEILKFSKIFDYEDIVIADKDNREPFTESAKIVICTYRTFLLISDHYYKLKNKKKSKKYRKAVIPFGNWGSSRVIYADESQELGNPTSRQSKVIHIHKRYFEYRYILSGTPADTKVNKLYSQIKFLDENIIPYSYQDFLSVVANIGSRFSKYSINYFYPEKIEKFLDSLHPFLSRRLLKDHLEFKEDYNKKVFIKLGSKQRSIYEELTKSVISQIKLENDGRISSSKIKNKFAFISLALHNPEILIKSLKEKSLSLKLETLLRNWKFSYASKLFILDDLIEEVFMENEQAKIVIWSGHPLTIESLANRYKKYNPLKVHGRLSEKGKSTEQLKSEVVHQFQNDNSKKILIGNFLSLSTQVSLVRANIQIYYDRNYNFIDFAQSYKRIQGIKQDLQTKSYILIYEDTIEEQQDLLLNSKSKVNQLIFERDVFSKDELKKIFNSSGL